jgi:hypothetical protein
VRLTIRRRAHLPVVTAVAAGLALSGCGALRPGVAARVDGSTLSLAEVDRTAALFCEASEQQLEAEGRAFPMGTIRKSVVANLVARRVADRVVDEYDVEPGPEYRQAVADQKAQADAVPEDAREVYLQVTTSSAYLESVFSQAARAQLADEGEFSPSEEQVGVRAADMFQVWPEEHVIEIDPRFGLTLASAGFSGADNSLSVALSETATSGNADEPPEDYVEGLTPTHRCG